MRRSTGPIRHRGAFLVVTTLVASLAVAFTPGGGRAQAGDSAPSPSAAPSPTSVASPLPLPGPTATPESGASPSAAPQPSGDPAVTAAGLAGATVAQVADAPADGSDRVAPGTIVRVTVSASLAAELDVADLVETLPSGWRLVAHPTGTWDAATRTLRWEIRGAAAGSHLDHTFDVAAPSLPAPDGALSIESRFELLLATTVGSRPGPELTILVASPLAVGSSVLGPIGTPGAEPAWIAPDLPLLGLGRFETVRVRYVVANVDSRAASLIPGIAFRRAGATGWTAITSGDAAGDRPFHLVPEYVREPSGAVLEGPEGTVVAAAELTAEERGSARPVDGYRVMGDPAPALGLAVAEAMVVEFTLRTGLGAGYGEAYELRMTDAGTPIPAGSILFVRMGERPAVELTPGQRYGRAAVSTTTKLQPTFRRLVAGPTLTGAATLSVELDPVHGGGLTSLASDSCAACHAAHQGRASYLLDEPAPQYGLCVTCHDGSTTGANIRAAYQPVGGTLPANDPATRSYYSHDRSTGASLHLGADADLFAGTSNRHNECADCHQPHRASSAVASTSDATGWTASSRLVGVSGVAVVNGAAGSAPVYTLVPSVTKEYGLCFKCHSGYTQLLANPVPAAGEPVPYSRYALDKGIESNPANRSTHPIEGPGTNATAAMAESLAGSSPYKLWQFGVTDTVRCVDCHADSSRAAALAASPAGPGAALPPHASQNRGILLLPYRDRNLPTASESYSATDDALCLACHAEGPLVDVSGEATGTNFPFHGMHDAFIGGQGFPGTNIDEPGVGQGHALCSECHFRIHSTAFPVPGQTLDGQTVGGGSRLVNFAPNVQAVTGYGSIVWNPRTGTTAGNCTLVCHGFTHKPGRSAYEY